MTAPQVYLPIILKFKAKISAAVPERSGAEKIYEISLNACEIHFRLIFLFDLDT